jgi:sugar-specific transcriptional regulator TrmB
MKESPAVSALVALGFSLNESRAYCALLRGGPATGYEVGARAQIPRSAVYGVLRRLVKAGAARSISGAPERFLASPSEDLLALLRRRFDQSTEKLSVALRDLDSAPATPDAFTVHGYDRVLEEAENVVRSATRRLVVSGWPRELRRLESEIRKAVKRKVFAVTFSHGRLPPLPGEVFSYGLEEAELESFWRHRIVVVADDHRALLGATEHRDSDSAVISESAAIGEIATSQVALDITLLGQRSGRDVRDVMARMLGDRVGRLDSVMGTERPAPVAAKESATRGGRATARSAKRTAQSKKALPQM